MSENEPNKEVLIGAEILIVDDEAMLRLLQKRFLERNGAITVLAENGQAALQILEGKDTPFDLILTDKDMVPGSGPELIAKIREGKDKLAVHQNTPIIINSGSFPKEGAEEMAKKIGANDGMGKPFELATLKEKAQKALSSSKKS